MEVMCPLEDEWTQAVVLVVGQDMSCLEHHEEAVQLVEA